MYKFLFPFLLVLGACTPVTTSEAKKHSKHSSGIASYYWQPQKTANGEQFNPNALTAAHKTLPMGTKVKVVNKRNNRSVTLRINDRGPFIKGRIIDVSKRAAEILGFKNQGLTPVDLYVVN